ncbi:MAG: DEAD/DEAH box helicase, partial [Candidatus Methanomethylophilaceae archaeon]|nr:DEAD/DEAH box helicase [Candidatus Methanomethylophilaceae archaeon]
MTDHFSSLPWFLREYVHSRRWGSFRAIQEATFDYFRRGDDHILISAGTSSGKTEAAMFPVITSLYNNPSDTVGALYIGPLKALIDDQFDRMD